MPIIKGWQIRLRIIVIMVIIIANTVPGTFPRTFYLYVNRFDPQQLYDRDIGTVSRHVT